MGRHVRCHWLFTSIQSRCTQWFANVSYRTAAALFCIVTGWSSGPGFVTIVSVMCSLFATRADPVAGGIGFMSGAACAAVAAALCNFVLLPAVSDFAMLAVITGGFMFAAGLAMHHPRTAAPGASFAIIFWSLSHRKTHRRCSTLPVSSMVC